MNLNRVWQLFKKDLAVGPRSPLMSFVLLMPLLMSLILHLVFGGLANSSPRLALVVEGESELAAAIEALPGFRLSRLDSADRLLQAVEANDFDAGLIIPAGFDRDLRSGGKPELLLYFSGESYAMDRLMVAISTIDQIRAVEGRPAPVQVEVLRVEEGDPVALSTRFVPVVVFYAFIMAGLFVPASILVEEKERRTLVAVLTSPATLTEVVVAKGLLGIVLAYLLALVSLLLNRVVVYDLPGLLLILLIMAVFWAMIGLMIGLLAKNSEMLFAIVKGSGAFLFAPVIFYLFPDWPQWIARLFPTFWAVDPLWQLVANEAGLADVWPSLVVVAAMCLAMLPALRALGRRTMRALA